MIKRNNRVVTQVLVKWNGVDATKSTWKDYSALAGRLPADNFMGEVVC